MKKFHAKATNKRRKQLKGLIDRKKSVDIEMFRKEINDIDKNALKFTFATLITGGNYIKNSEFITYLSIKPPS